MFSKIKKWFAKKEVKPSVEKEEATKFSGKEVVDMNKALQIKGNVNQKKQKIYHLPNQRFYEQIKNPEHVFKSEEEAKEAGFRKSKV